MPTKKATNHHLRFVVQLHDASHLYYAFRLEMDGVLKSWAIPKGPTIDPATKRLAMIVEDHPLTYQKFEGIIPEGSYGAGTVMIWDEGTYEPLNIKGSRKTQEKAMLEELKEGSIKVVLHGKKLKGEVALVRTKGRGENSWLYIKHRDEFAGTADITKKNKSVKSEKTLKQIATSSKNIYEEKIVQPGSTAKDHVVAENKKGKAKSKKEEAKGLKAEAVVDVNAMIRKGKKAPFPKTISPMLATLVNEPFDEPGWIYEIKWDGYRAISLINKKDVQLISRNNKSFNEKFYPIYNAVKAWHIQAVADGEIVVINKKGISDFSSLQGWRSEADGDLVYYVFDLLWLDGYDLTKLSLKQRREILQSILPDDSSIRMSENFETSAAEFLEAAKQLGVEGIIAKKADSEYTIGERTKDWLKIKVNKRHEVVIGGFTNNEGSGKAFSSLLVGVYENGKLEYTGKIGTGFNDKQQREMMKQFKPLVSSKCPFTFVPDVNKPSRFRPNPPKATATWLQPKLVCEVSYAEITQDGVMRHPSFEGMREDKSAKSVTREKALPVEKVIEEEKEFSEKKLFVPSKDKDRKTLLNPKDETQVRTVNGHELKFTNLSKVFWPKEKYTKRDMINYYYQVAAYILPYLKDRPQSLNRFPHGIDGESFYQKDVTGKVPDWLKTFPYHTREENADKNYMICTDEAGVLFMANLGCIEMNPWNSTIKKPDHPTWCILDLDPDTKNTFEQVIQTAQVVKQVFDSLGVPSYCKTSGSTGMHIYIPLGAKYTYDECQLFGKLVATQVHNELPAFTSIERLTRNRKGKLYIDYLQNRPKATLAAPYSLRPKPGATVSMPLHWEEVKKGLALKDFTIENAVARIKNEGDIFKPVIGKGIDLKKVLKAFEV